MNDICSKGNDYQEDSEGLCNFIIIHNKKMNSYLEKYHLQKVEPVKNRNRNTQTDFYKIKQKVEKGNVVKIPIKPRPAHNNYFHNEEIRSQYRNPKTEQIIRSHNQFTQNNNRKRNREQEIFQERISHRSHQSLNFKSAKDTSAGTRIISTLQDFFSRLTRSNEGCNCGDPCPNSVKFFQWADIPYEIVKDHYFKSQHNLREILKSNPNESSKCSIENYINQKTVKFQSHIQELRKNQIQIWKDIDRTQSECSTFQNQRFKEKMYNILMCYGFEDIKVGYIQGMNMILSGIIYHVKDQIKAYAVFRKIIYSIRAIYLNGFKQCYQHISNIKSYVNTHVHDLYELFDQLMVDLNIVCLPWVLSLLTSLVPLQYLHHIYLGFIQDGWPFIYRVSLAIMIYHKEKAIELYDSGQILSLFSATNEKKGDYDWQDIINFSKSIVL